MANDKKTPEAVESHSTDLNVKTTGLSALQEPLGSIILTAIEQKATDIHIDPVEDSVLLRIRVDGVIHENTDVDIPDQERLLNQVKLAADINIERSFTPEEGTIHLEKDDRLYEVRVTIVPVEDKAAIHLRFRSGSRRIRELSDLGFSDFDMEVVSPVLERKAGLILVSGATGSGKSTTLYALANDLNMKKRIIVSIEDPVEFRIPEIRQMQVDEVHDLTMYSGLKTILRADPDVIIVGEIRDQASAVTAARAALTGQLVIATIHAPDDLTTLEAMRYFSVPNYVIGGSLRLIVTQELVRRLCRNCAQETELTDEQAALFEKFDAEKPDHIYEASGCETCNGYGFLGSIGVFEVTPISDELGHDLSGGMKRAELRDRFRTSGKRHMVHDALEKAAQGLISMSEVDQLYRGLGRPEPLHAK